MVSETKEIIKFQRLETVDHLDRFSKLVPVISDSDLKSFNLS